MDSREEFVVSGENSKGTGRRPGRAVRRLLVDSPGSVGAGARARRWRLIQQLYPHLSDMTVVDLGGTVEAWLRGASGPPRVVQLAACDLPGVKKWFRLVLTAGWFVGRCVMTTRPVTRRGILVDGRRPPALRFGDPRVMARAGGPWP